MEVNRSLISRTKFEKSKLSNASHTEGLDEAEEIHQVTWWVLGAVSIRQDLVGSQHCAYWTGPLEFASEVYIW